MTNPHETLVDREIPVPRAAGDARASESVSDQADDTPIMVKTFKAGETKDEAMLNATHWPDWYTQDFKKIATAMRDSMQAQSVASGGGPSASGGARRDIRKGGRTLERAADRAMETMAGTGPSRPVR